MRPASPFHHGLYYEQLAADYLLKKGYKIIGKNVRYKCGEIDLIAEHQQTLVFIEVRKRDPQSWITPLETMTFPKVRRFKNAVQIYLSRYQGRAQKVRLDFIGITEQESGPEFIHVEQFID